MLTAVRFAAYHTHNKETGTTFLEYDKLTANTLTYMASVKTEFTRELYKLVDGLSMPTFEAELQLGYVGSSSLNSIATLKNIDTGEILATNTNQVVVVDKTTRRPTPIPDWWKDKYISFVAGNKRLIVPPLEVPEKFYTQNITVAWSDMDAYRHTNYSCYIRYCQDCVLDGHANGYFTKYQEGFWVKSMDISYRGESMPGDQLKIKCWEEANNPYLLHFDISLKDTTIFQSSIMFFEPIL